MGNHIENIPILGHVMSAFYSINGDEEENAQKTAIKASVDIVPPFALLNPIIDIIHESDRKESAKLLSSKYLRNNTNWMKRYHSNKITDLWIPASHGSGTYSIHKSNDHIFGGNWFKTQRLNITKQLNAGIRFLDIKLITKYAWPASLERSYSTLNLTENMVYISNVHKGCLFGTILSQICAFVDMYSTEIVILKVDRDKYYHKSSINNTFHFLPIFKILIEICGDRLISAHNDGMDRKNKTIKELTHNGTKGRILLLLSSSVMDLELCQSYCGYTNICSDDNECCYPSKWFENVMEFWITQQFGGTLKGITGLMNEEQFENMTDYASVTNYNLFQFLQNENFEERNRKLVITHDYINDDIIELIIAKNDRYYDGYKLMNVNYEKEICDGTGTETSV